MDDLGRYLPRLIRALAVFGLVGFMAMAVLSMAGLILAGVL